MQIRFPAFLKSLGVSFTGNASDSRSKYELQAAPRFLFEQKQFGSEWADRTPGQPEQLRVGAVLSGTRAPYLRTRIERLTLSCSDIPALTLAVASSNMVQLIGNSRDDWSLQFCGEGEGNSEAEALTCLEGFSLVRVGGTVFLNSPNRIVGGRGNLIIDAPADAPTTVHASFAAVEVRNMTGPVRVTAIHGRAKILNTIGRVDATGFVIDFAGSEGNVTLSAEAEINLKLTATRFQGALTAWAQRPVRVLVPRAFQTPFQALVNRPQDFVCRADLCSNVKSEKRGGLYAFTYLGDGSTSPERMHLRSEHATVVIDNAD
jgi:hypothetical protein